ncbi:MAG: ABC transporter permease [Pirellulales bacterium]
MTSFILRRLLYAVLTLLCVSFLTYALIRFMPGDPISMMYGDDPSRKVDPETIYRLKEPFGLNDPWYIGYGKWLKSAVQLDFQKSIRYGRKVEQVIAETIPATLLLSGTSLVITYLLSVPLGLYSTVRSGKWDERSSSLFFYGLYSLPSFVAGLQLLVIFYVGLRDTPYQLSPGMVSDNYSELGPVAKFFDIAKHMILPVFCFTYGSLAYYSRFIKANMEEAMRQDYVRTARAKGAGQTAVVFVHAFRNTMIPFVTQIGLSLPALLGGSIILEQIFAWPGMGQEFISAITFKDIPMVMGLVMMFGVLTIAGQLLADILYAWVDPRVTYK